MVEKEGETELILQKNYFKY